jgi:8-oxo-dGTP pyrophosphatase MutT (NUDIX family)
MIEFKKWSGVILKHKDEVLLCKRAPDKSLPNIWSIPSGKIESGESPGVAALREFYEETNLKLNKNLDFVGFLNKYKKNKTKKGHMFVFLFDSDKKLEPDLKEAKDGWEHTSCKYFKQDEIPKQKGNEELLEILNKIF